MKYVLFYESADDVLAKAPAHFDAHTRPRRRTSTTAARC